MSLKIVCPKCHGKKTMNDPEYIGKMIGYCDKDGNTCPQVTCVTCAGVGHLLDNSSPYTLDNETIKAMIKKERAARKKAQQALKPKSTPLSKRSVPELMKDLEKALAVEDYEQCAKIRDLLRKKGS